MKKRRDLRAEFLTVKALPLDPDDPSGLHVVPLAAKYLEGVVPLINRLEKNEDDAVAVAELSAMAACYCLTDPSGERLFDDGQIDDVARAKSIEDLTKILDRVLEVSGFADGTGDDDSRP